MCGRKGSALEGKNNSTGLSVFVPSPLPSSAAVKSRGFPEVTSGAATDPCSQLVLFHVIQNLDTSASRYPQKNH